MIALPIFLLGVAVIMIAAKGHASVSDDALRYWWLGKREIPWEGMKVARAPANGALGAAMMPLRITRADGKAFNFPVGTFQGKDELIATLKERTGSEF